MYLLGRRIPVLADGLSASCSLQVVICSRGRSEDGETCYDTHIGSCLVLLMEKSQSYALQVWDEIDEAGYHVDVDTADGKLQKRIREAQLAQYNYILVVGEDEAKSRQVNVRLRDKPDRSVKSIEDLLTHLKEEASAFH